MILVTLWINRGEADLELMQAIIDSIYVIDPAAVIGERYRYHHALKSKFRMYIQTTEKAVAFVRTGLLNAGGAYVDQGVGNGVIPIKKWTPEGHDIKSRPHYVYRSGVKEHRVLTPNTAYTVKRRRLGGSHTKHADPSPRIRHPNTREDQSRSYKELADDSDIHNEQAV